MSRFRHHRLEEDYPAHVVNGGLIDFRDNTSRGAYDASMGSPLQVLQQQQQQQQQPGGFITIQPQQVPQAIPVQAAYVQNGQTVNGMIQGPPTYVQFGGVLYKPVEAVPTEVKDQAPAAPSQAADTMEPLKAAVDEYVKKRVQEYTSQFAPQGAPVPLQSPAERTIRTLTASMPSRASRSGGGLR